MLTNAERCDLENDFDTNYHCAEGIREIAGRLEKAVTPCNQFKMREALLMVKKLFDGQIMFQNAIKEAHKAVSDALSAQAVNAIAEIQKILGVKGEANEQ